MCRHRRHRLRYQTMWSRTSLQSSGAWYAFLQVLYVDLGGVRLSGMKVPARVAVVQSQICNEIFCCVHSVFSGVSMNRDLCIPFTLTCLEVWKPSPSSCTRVMPLTVSRSWTSRTHMSGPLESMPLFLSHRCPQQPRGAQLRVASTMTPPLLSLIPVRVSLRRETATMSGTAFFTHGTLYRYVLLCSSLHN